jgi:hypothetical protein
MRQRVPKAGDDDLKEGDERGYSWGDKRGNQYVRTTLGYFRAHTPADAALDEGPCDAILLSIDTTVTGRAADDPASIALMPYKAGQWHHASYERISAVGGGSLWVGWYRKPNPPTP